MVQLLPGNILRGCVPVHDFGYSALFAHPGAAVARLPPGRQGRRDEICQEGSCRQARRRCHAAAGLRARARSDAGRAACVHTTKFAVCSSVPFGVLAYAPAYTCSPSSSSNQCSPRLSMGDANGHGKK
eukprot:5187378-Pleurochrysis_carterae.AAC.1